MIMLGKAAFSKITRSVFPNNQKYGWLSYLAHSPLMPTQRRQKEDESRVQCRSPVPRRTADHKVGAIRTLIVGPLYYPHLGRRFRLPPTRRPELTKYRRTKPITLSEVQDLAVRVEDMDNTTLTILGEMGDHNARREILKRHIMAKDKVTYDEANKTFATIAERNKDGQYLLALPYKIGVIVACSAAAASFPLCFHLGTAEWFNENYVTTDVPESEELETWLEVGAWTWNCTYGIIRSFRFALSFWFLWLGF